MGDRRLVARMLVFAALAALCVSVALALKCRDCEMPSCTNTTVCEAPYCAYTEMNNTNGAHTITYRCMQMDALQYPGLGDGPPDHMGKCIKRDHKGLKYALKICNDTDLCNTGNCALVEPEAEAEEGDSGHGNDTSSAGQPVLYSATALVLFSLLAVS